MHVFHAPCRHREWGVRVAAGGMCGALGRSELKREKKHIRIGAGKSRSHIFQLCGISAQTSQVRWNVAQPEDLCESVQRMKPSQE